MSIDCESPRTSSTPPAPSTFNVQTVSPPLGTTAPTLANSIAEEVQSQLEPRLVGMLTEWQNKQNALFLEMHNKQAGLLRLVADAISVQVREEHAETRQEVAMLRQEVLSLRMQIERLRTGR